MPWGWECRAKLIKQLPAKPTERKGKVALEFGNPAPNIYESPELFCGKGYSHIKRSPAYTFGHYTPATFSKPGVLPSAPILDMGGMGYKGSYKIKHGIISPMLELPRDNVKTPGPCNYAPNNKLRYKQAPTYSMRPAARPPYQPWDMWTPSPNMYLPYMPGKKCPPAYSFGNVGKPKIISNNPEPGAHDPNFNYVKKNKPAYSFGAPYRSFKPVKEPPPNVYCEKKFNYTKRTIPAPTFGIRHTPYLGTREEYLKPDDLNIVISGND